MCNGQILKCVFPCKMISLIFSSHKQPKEPKEKGEGAKKEAKPRPAPRQPRLPHDPLAIRTIVVAGLPPAIDAKVLWKKIRKYTGAEKDDWPVKDDAGEEDSTTGEFLVLLYRGLNRLTVFNLRSPCSIRKSRIRERCRRQAARTCI